VTRSIGQWRIRPAGRADLKEITHLLQGCDLPFEDVAKHVADFLVARDGQGVLIGSIGVERLGPYGLLRSLAVAESHRGWGVAKELVRHLLDRIAERGDIKSIYLLTTTASEFFLQFGFYRVARSSVPAEVAGSQEFRVYCPESAIAMTRSPEG